MPKRDDTTPSTWEEWKKQNGQQSGTTQSEATQPSSWNDWKAQKEMRSSSAFTSLRGDFVQYRRALIDSRIFDAGGESNAALLAEKRMREAMQAQRNQLSMHRENYTQEEQNVKAQEIGRYAAKTNLLSRGNAAATQTEKKQLPTNMQKGMEFVGRTTPRSQPIGNPSEYEEKSTVYPHIIGDAVLSYNASRAKSKEAAREVDNVVNAYGGHLDENGVMVFNTNEGVMMYNAALVNANAAASNEFAAYAKAVQADRMYSKEADEYTAAVKHYQNKVTNMDDSAFAKECDRLGVSNDYALYNAVVAYAEADNAIAQFGNPYVGADSIPEEKREEYNKLVANRDEAFALVEKTAATNKELGVNGAGATAYEIFALKEDLAVLDKECSDAWGQGYTNEKTGERVWRNETDEKTYTELAARRDALTAEIANLESGFADGSFLQTALQNTSAEERILYVEMFKRNNQEYQAYLEGNPENKAPAAGSATWSYFVADIVSADDFGAYANPLRGGDSEADKRVREIIKGDPHENGDWFRFYTINGWMQGGSARDDIWYYYVSDEEKSVYNYLFLHPDHGVDEARAFLTELEPTLKARSDAEMAGWASELANDHPILASFMSVALNLGGIFSLGEQAFQYGMKKAFGADVDDRNLLYTQGLNFSGQMRAGVSEDTASPFVYNTAMSILDFAASFMVGGSIGGFGGATGGVSAGANIPAFSASIGSGIAGGGLSQAAILTTMSSTAAVNTMLSAKARGLDEDQAFALGVGAFIIEYFSERVSLEVLLDKGSMGKSIVGYLIKNFTAEASEEGASAIANLFADILVSQDKSEWDASIQAYMDEDSSISREDATKKAFWKQAESVLLEMAAGGISGLVIGGGFAAANSIASHQSAKAYGTSFANNIMKQKGTKSYNAFASMAGVTENDSDAEVFAKLKILGENVYKEASSASAPISRVATQQEQTEARAEQVAADNPDAESIGSAGAQAYIERGVQQADAQQAGIVIDGIVSGEITAESITNAQIAALLPTTAQGAEVIAFALGVDVVQPKSAAAAKKTVRAAIRAYQSGAELSPSSDSETVHRNITVTVNGKAATFTGIAYENGKTLAIVKAEDGTKSKLPVSAVADMPKNTAERVERVAARFGAAAPTVYAAYMQGQSFSGYLQGAEMVADIAEHSTKSYSELSEQLQSMDATAALTEAQQSLIFEAVRKAKNAVATDDSTGYTENTRIKGADNNGKGQRVHLRNSGKRTGGQNSGGELRGVEETAGRNPSRESGAEQRAFRAAAQADARRVSPRDLGLDGSEKKTLRIVDTGYSKDARRAAKYAERHGFTLTLFTGGNLQLHGENGDFSARAFIRGKQIFVRADHSGFTAYQLARHEYGHALIASGQLDMSTVRERMVKTFGKVNFDRISRYYAQAYESSGLDAEGIWEEICCDSIGDMNIFAELPMGTEVGAFLSQLKQQAKQDIAGTEATAQRQGKASREINPADAAYLPLAEKFRDGTATEEETEQLQRMVNDKAEQSGAYIFEGKERNNTVFEMRVKPKPRQTITVYKLFDVVDGKPQALYIDEATPKKTGNGLSVKKSTGTAIPVGVWLDAKAGQWHYGENGRKYVYSKLGDLAYRPGWHASSLPFTGHIGDDIADAPYGKVKRPNQVYYVCEIDADTDYADAVQNIRDKESDQSLGLDRVPVDGFYEFKTNSNATDDVSWYISGALKVVRPMSEQEVNTMLAENGITPQLWETVAGTKKKSAEKTVKNATGELNLAFNGINSTAAVQNFGKIIDPVTYDDAGNIIPLSERFNTQKEDIRFSRELEQIAVLQEENKLLRSRVNTVVEQNERLRGQLRQTKTPSVRLADIDKAAKKLLESYSSTADFGTIRNSMKSLADFIVQNGDGTNELTWSEVKNRAREIAADVVSNASELANAEELDTFREIRSVVRQTPIRFTDKSEIPDYGAFRKRNFGRIRLVNSNGIGMDSFYQSLQETYGYGYFPDGIDHPADQLLHIEQVLRHMEPIYENPHTYYMAEATEFCACEIVDTLLSDSVRQTAPTFADRQKAKLDAAVAEGRIRARDAISRERQHRERAVAEIKEQAKERVAEIRETAAVKQYRAKVEKTTAKLTELLLKNSDKQHIPESLKSVVGDFLNSLDFSSKRALSGGEQTQRDIRYTQTLDRLRQVLQGQADYMANPDNNAGMDCYIDLPEGFVDQIQAHINTVRDATANIDIGTAQVNAMNAAQLQDLNFILKVLNASIRQINQLVANGHFATVQEAAGNTIRELDELGKASKRAGTWSSRFLQWDNTTPFYAFKRFGEAGKSIFDGLMNGWDTFAFNIKAILSFSKKTYSAKEVKSWGKELHTVQLSSGESVQMTTAQIMSLRALSKREQAVGHLLGGGMRVANIDVKGNKVKQTTPFLMTLEDIQAVTDVLTDRQREVADKLQAYMNTVGTDWGNKVSMQRFGYRAFTEKNYFPIESDKTNLPASDPQAKENDLFRLLNLTMTKSLTYKANNALVINDIFDVFANHMADMAKYNALALPVLDAMKWYNYKNTTKLDSGQLQTQTVQRAIETAYGKDANGYFITFLRDLNGTKEGGRGEDIIGRFTSRYKVAAVAANLRVALLQPTSYARAVAVLNPKYMARAMRMKPSVAEMQNNSGIGAWKALGYYDTNIGRNIREQIKGSATVTDKITEKSMVFAELGDKLTWGVLWNACKLEQQAKTGLTGNELLDETAKRFREVIYATQVVDSTMTRSHMMRSSGQIAKTLTAFMSEPTLSYNLLLDAYSGFDAVKRKTGSKAAAWKQSGTHITLALAAYAVSQLAAAIAEGIADAFRDDDEYENFLEKFQEAFGENLVADMLPFNKLPFIKDAVSLLTGYANNRMDTEFFKNIIDAAKIWYETIAVSVGWQEDYTDVTYNGKMTLYGKIYKSLQAASRLLGLPMSNATREIAAIWNNTIGVITGDKLKTYDPGDEASIRYAYLDGYLTEKEAREQLMKTVGMDEDGAYWTVEAWSEGTKFGEITAAVASKDTAAIQSAIDAMIEHGYSEKEALSKVASATRAAFLDGELSENDAENILRTSCGMDSDDIFWTFESWTDGTKFGRLEKAVVSNDSTAISAFISDMTAHGYTAEEAASAVKSAVKTQFTEGTVSASAAQKIITTYGGVAAADAGTTVRTWEFAADNPDMADITVNAYGEWETLCKPLGVAVKVYYDTWKFKGSCDGEVKKQVMAYISKLNLSNRQKDALYLCWWKESTISDAPWH